MTVDGHQNTILTIGFRFVLQSPLCFEATVSTWRALWLSAMGKQFESDPVLIIHRGRALRLLQQAFSQSAEPASDEVALAVSYLLSAEVSVPEPLQSFGESLTGSVRWFPTTWTPSRCMRP